MSALRKSSLVLLSLNDIGLDQKVKMLTLFSSLMNGPWDAVLLQETHHGSNEQGR